ncbi:PLP-dependent aminotransferase family protein [uncultured Sneathiella sp.]|uniref:MocR-like ectoine utilization transcription factor EhuR n=1 Tax=uncultured Sneathiella sp. TaxID=879315 RepID=UPI0030EF27E8|tara:strand:+ start:20280 stop:21671 length:1392 start_codon:yes stop_codon:yes gene_type:complete
MTIWTPCYDNLTRPLHTSLVSAFKEAIADGRLPAGTQLLPHRTLAHKLGISVHTVGKAYEELKRLGLIDGHVGRGTYVLSPTLPSRQPYLMERGNNGTIDLSISRPLIDHIHVDRMDAALKDLPVGLDHDTYLACRPNVGLRTHREAGVDWLSRCQLDISPESVIITNGVTHGMAVALSAVTRPGDIVVTESIVHHLIISQCSYLGLRLQGLEFDEQGIVPEAFEIACKSHDVKVYFSVPTVANPMATMMSEERRRELVGIARRYDVFIIEDDAWGPLVEDRPLPFMALAPERTIYLTSFTKCTLSGLRTGYLVAPDSLIPAITGRLIAFSWMGTPLVAELASRWIKDGTADELVQWQRQALAERHTIIKEEMTGLSWRGHPNSLHFWLELPEGWDTTTYVNHANSLGIAIAPTQPFLTPNIRKADAVRIAVAGTQDTKRFRRGLSAIRNLLRRAPEPFMHSL